MIYRLSNVQLVMEDGRVKVSGILEKSPDRVDWEPVWSGSFMMKYSADSLDIVRDIAARAREIAEHDFAVNEVLDDAVSRLEGQEYEL